MSCLKSSDEGEQRRKSKAIDNQLKKDREIYFSTHRIFLCGTAKSGKSTLMQQMKLLQEGGYTHAECLEKVRDIHSHIKEIILTVIRAMPALDPPIELADSQNKESVKYLLDVVAKPGFADYTPAFFEIVAKLWQDDGVKACYARSNEYQLNNDSAEYFMDPNKLKKVADPAFRPSYQDVLWGQASSGITETKITIERVHFHFFDVSHLKLESTKWIQHFNDVTAIVFVVDCSSFDVVDTQMDIATNRLQESLNLFETLWNNRWLRSVSFIMLLNKQDLLNAKIERGVKIEDYFPAFDSYNLPENTWLEPGESQEFIRAKYFIRDQFVKISMKTHDGRHFLYTHFTTAVDTENIRRIFNSCRDIIHRKHLIKHEML